MCSLRAEQMKLIGSLSVMMAMGCYVGLYTLGCGWIAPDGNVASTCVTLHLEPQNWGLLSTPQLVSTAQSGIPSWFLIRLKRLVPPAVPHLDTLP